MKSLLILMSLLSLNALALAGEDPFYTRPRLSPQGDWLTNAGPVPGKVQGGAMSPGALWRVMVPNLNCRQQPDIQSPLVMSFASGQLLQANHFRGGSDEVLLNAKDRLGRTWMWVRSPEGKDLNCYVRAHQSLIQPLKPAVTPVDTRRKQPGPK